MTKTAIDEYNEGKLSALIEAFMAVARQTMTPQDFRAAVLPALERLETHALHSSAPDSRILGIQTLRQWMDEQSQPAADAAAYAAQTQKK